MFWWRYAHSIATESPYSLGSRGHSGFGALRSSESERICVTPLIAVLITSYLAKWGSQLGSGGGGATWLREGGQVASVGVPRPPWPPLVTPLLSSLKSFSMVYLSKYDFAFISTQLSLVSLVCYIVKVLYTQWRTVTILSGGVYN